MDDTKLIPVKRILNVINSCETLNQLKSARVLIEGYVKILENNGLDNPDLVMKRLIKEYKQKHFQITAIKYFIQTQRKVFYEEYLELEPQKI